MTQICIPLEVARLIDRVYLPRNPNKVRSATSQVLAAVRDFKESIARAEGAQP